VDQNYVDTGKVLFTFHPVAFLSQDSANAAEAAYCASDQNKVWPMYAILYANQGSETATTFGKDQLKQLAKQAGLDTTAFNSCIDSGKYTAQVNSDTQAVASSGIQSVPSFIIDGQLYQLQGTDTASITKNFLAKLDAELAK
jgi:protein-disulfide isomerase